MRTSVSSSSLPTRPAVASARRSWRSHGLARLSLETGAANTVARRFYEKLGYEVEDVRLSRPL